MIWSILTGKNISTRYDVYINNNLNSHDSTLIWHQHNLIVSILTSQKTWTFLKNQISSRYRQDKTENLNNHDSISIQYRKYKPLTQYSWNGQYRIDIVSLLPILLILYLHQVFDITRKAIHVTLPLFPLQRERGILSLPECKCLWGKVPEAVTLQRHILDLFTLAPIVLDDEKRRPPVMEWQFQVKDGFFS